METSRAKQEAEEILRRSLEQMEVFFPGELNSRLKAEGLLEEINGLIAVQSQGDNLVMGVFDLNINEYATISIPALIIALSEVLGRIISGNPEYSALSTAICTCSFIATLLNMIQPQTSIELDMTDAKVYCKLLQFQRERPVNEVIAYEKVVQSIKEVDKEADISRCLDHLQEKKLIRRAGDGFIVIREVKVKGV